MSDFLFLGIPFKAISLEDQETLERHLKKYPQSVAGYTFASLFSWACVYGFQWAFLEPETLLFSVQQKKDEYPNLLQPIGIFSHGAQELLLKACHKESSPIKFFNISQEFLERFPAFCGHFTTQQNRNSANYVYRASDLAELKGRNYEKKRNLIAQAEKLYQWRAMPLSTENVSFCEKILLEIEPSEAPETLKNEYKALKHIIENFAKLKQEGLLITINDIPAAFSIYERQNPETAAVHFEKADRRYKGLYQLINRATAQKIQKEGYTFINREEDMGISGLRQAKLSYSPVILVPSYILNIS